MVWGPIALTLAGLLLLAGALAVFSKDRRELLFIFAVMLWNAGFAYVATMYGAPALAAVGYISSAMFLILGGTQLQFAIATLYLPRLVFVAGALIFGIPHWIMWDLSNAVLLVQILLLAGGSANATRKHIGRMLDSVGGLLARSAAIEKVWKNLSATFGPFRPVDSH